MEKREFNTTERKKLADKGQAMPDGSYPIANEGDLKNAIQAFGRAKNPDAVKQHITSRAKSLGLTSLLPDNWQAQKCAEKSGFKFYIKLEKAYQENGDYYVQGVASGLLEDRDDERMGPGVLKAFFNKIKTEGLPLTDAHPEKGPIMGQVGTVIDAQLMNDANNSLFIKAKLDKDNPAVPYLIKQIQKGKKFAFSIEGIDPVRKTVWSQKLKQNIIEYESVSPTAISITTLPSYIPSFLEVVSKSYQNKIKNNLVNLTNMKDKKTETAKATEAPEVKTEVVAAPAEVEKAKAVSAADNTAKKPAGNPDTTIDNPISDSGTVGTIEDGMEKDDDAAEMTIEDKVAALTDQVTAMTGLINDLRSTLVNEEEEEGAADNDDDESAEGGEVSETSAEPALEMTEKVTNPDDTSAVPASPEDEKGGEMSNWDKLDNRLTAIEAKLQSLVESDANVHDEAEKSRTEMDKVMKSMYDTITRLPLQKRSKAVAPVFEDLKEKAPTTIREATERLFF